MPLKIKKSDSASVSTPRNTHVQLFVDASGTLCIKDSTGTVATVGSGSSAAALATTGADVDVSGAAPPSTGQYLVATSATTATWQTPAFGSGAGTFCEGNDARLTDDRTGSGLRSASTVVVVSAATAPTNGQVLTATSGTAANWQTPVAGGSDPVSEFWCVPAAPHANDREMTSLPSGWSLFRVGTGLGSTAGTLTSPTAGTPNFSVGLSTNQTRIAANLTQKRSWLVWDSFVEDRAWFYGYSMTFGSAHILRARLNTLNSMSGPTGANGGLLQLCVILDSGGVPNFDVNTGVGFRLGWQPGIGTMPIVNGFHGGGSAGTYFQSSDLSEMLNSDCEFVMRSDATDGYWFTRTAGCTLSYGAIAGMTSALVGQTVWVGFLWNNVTTIATGGRMFSADYLRQQNDSLFYG